MDDFTLALAHYRLLFPDLASLGVGTPPPIWKTEYDRVAASGLSATLLTSTTMEGGGGGFIRNYDQKTLLAALHTRRGELDSDYLATLTAAAPVTARPAGIVVRFGP